MKTYEKFGGKLDWDIDHQWRVDVRYHDGDEGWIESLYFPSLEAAQTFANFERVYVVERVMARYEKTVRYSWEYKL